MREVFKVLKTGGKLIAEVYKGANTTVATLAEKYASQAGMKCWTSISIGSFSPKRAIRTFKSLRSQIKDGSAELGRKP